MKLNLFKVFFMGVIIFTSSITLPAQKQYTLNKDKTYIKLIVNQSKTKYTVSDILESKRGHPLAEADVYNLDINMDTVGFWTKSPQENTWKLDIRVPDSKGFFISFTDFYLPEGSKLYAYNSNDPQKAQVFKYEDNPNGGAYSLENLKGDNVTLEYVTSANIKENPKLHFLNVGYKYQNDLGAELSGFNSSANFCMVNINCPAGEAWQAHKKGIVHLRMLKSDKKTYLCSGTLINNTSNDKTPYILTAYHCFENMSEDEIKQTEFFFEYESPTCEENTLPTYKYHKGSEVLVLNPLNNGSDGALLKLNDTIPNDWDVYFNGWDRVNQISNIKGGSIIHHPLGDVKKITTYNQSPTSGKWSNNAPNGTHWIVRYALGVTKGGSSGAPIFNSNGLVIGTLTGGDSSCDKPTYADKYGKFWYHWDQYPDTNIYMSKYLDPLNTKVEKLSGLYNNENAERELLLEKYEINLMANVTSSVKIYDGNGNYTVTSSDEDIVTADISGNTVNISTLKLGHAVLKITDKKSKIKEIKVSVHKHIDFIIDKSKALNINVYKEDDTIKEIILIDLDGNTLYKKQNLEEKVHSINMEAYRKGLYIIQVKTKNGTIRSEKFIW